jgi:four helix bundle protein
VRIQERAFVFACRIVRLSKNVDRSAAGRHLGGQLLRAGTAVGANLEEAHAAHSKPDFIAKVSIALKEARETLYWLRLVRECDIVPADRLDDLLIEADELVAILSSIRRNSQDPKRSIRLPTTAEE